MSTISLRSYNREIESMIEQGQIDEAVDHARHILRKFPKVIETYRLLGKAYLENEQNNDAADIFQRVLSAVPDDFVAHIGMSLIREEEGNLSSAVQHMERAFEKQPYNNAIQEELKRLYGKRDGIEPPKVRLTQGALARMYLKGDLHQQGISELRSALAENPTRYDLKTLLAEAYTEADQMAEAIDLSSDILKKFPFNLTANRILANTLKTHDHPQEMAICRKRLYALSPYEAYVSDHAPSVDQVPDRAIALERLDWSADQQSFPTRTREETSPWSATQPDDKESQTDTPAPENLDWLDPGTSSEEDTIAEDTFDAQGQEQEPSQPEGEKIPDWMEEAGWSETDSISEEQERGFQDLFDDESEPEDEEIAPADIPDWLMEKSPLEDTPQEEAQPDKPLPLESEPDDQQPLVEPESQSEQEQVSDGSSAEPAAQPPVHAEPEPEEIQPSDDDLPAWLKDLKSEEDSQETAIAWLKDMPEELRSPQDQNLPTPGEEEPADSPPSVQDEPEDADLGWLQDMIEEESDQEASASEEPQETLPAQEPQASELQDQPIDGQEAAEDTDIPAWLQELADEGSESEASPGKKSEFDLPGAESDQPEPSPAEPVQPPGEEELPEPPQQEDDSDGDLDWSPGFELDEISDKPAKAETDSAGEPGTRESQPEDEEVPEWLFDLEFDDEGADDLELPDLEPDPATTEDADLTAEEPELQADAEVEPPREEIQQEAEEADLPDWLAELAEEDQQSLEPDEPDVSPEQHEASPQQNQDALPDLEQSEVPLPEVQEPQPDSEDERAAPQTAWDQDQDPSSMESGDPGVEQEETPDLDDEDETLAWLESLAAKQGAKEEDFVTSPEARADAKPPRDQEPDEPAEEEAAPAVPDTESEVTEPPSQDETQWEEAEPAAEADLPDWLADLQTSDSGAPDEVFKETDVSEPGAESFPGDSAEPEITEDLEADTEETTEFELEPDEPDEMPGWLADFDDQEQEAAEQPAFSEQDLPAMDEEVFPPQADESEGMEEHQELDWLDSLTEDTESTTDAGSAALPGTPDESIDRVQPGSPPEEMEPEAAGAPPLPEDRVPQQEESPSADQADLPDWLAELDGESSGESGAADPAAETSSEEESPWDPEADRQPLTVEPDQEPGEETPAEPDVIEQQKPAPQPQDEASPGLEVSSETEVQKAEEPARPPSPEEEPAPEPGFSGGMLDRLKASETGELEKESVPDWIKDLKEEEDPQETAILWLKNFIEKGDQADLKTEIEHYTDNLKPNQNIPDWMEDLQKEEDPQTTAMLWLEKLEEEQIQQSSTGPATDELDDTDWLDELEREQEARSDTQEEEHLDLEDRDWLSELEKDQAETEEEQPADPDQVSQSEHGEETPPWMKPTSPLEGDFLTGDLESELQQDQEEEEIPDWLAGYEDEEDLPTQPADDKPVTEGDPPEDTAVQSDQEYTWVTEDSDARDTPAAETAEDAPPEHQAVRDRKPAQQAEKSEQVSTGDEAEKVNLNEAGLAGLESILGISFTTAQAVIEYRSKHGTIRSYQELLDQEVVANQEILAILQDATYLPEPGEDQPTDIDPDSQEPVFENKFQKRHFYAQKALQNGEIEKALEDYEILIEKKKQLDEVIDDLNSASLEYPMNVEIIKTLGDAYMRKDQLQEALDAYSKAEDLLR